MILEISNIERFREAIVAKEQVIIDRKFSLIEILTSNSGLIGFLIFGWNIKLLTAWMAAKKWHIKITNERLEFVKGLLGSKQESIEFYRASDSDYRQSLIQSIFGVGTVRVISSDATSSTVEFPISNPNEVRDKIRGFIREQRKEMGTVARD